MEEKNVEELILELGNPDPGALVEAILYLGFSSKAGRDVFPAVSALAGTLENEAGKVRWSAAFSFLQIAANGIDISAAVPALSKRLLDNREDSEVRMHAAKALGAAKNEKCRQSAVSALIYALENGPPEILGNVAFALGNAAKNGAGISPAVPKLIRMISSANTTDGNAAARVLDEIGEAAIPGLIEALISGNEKERAESTERIVKIGKPAVPALMEVFLGADRDASLKAYKCLEEIRDPSLIPKLLEMLRARDRSMKQALEILGATEPRNVSDWNELRKIGIEFKKNNNWKKDIFPGSLERTYLRIISVHSKWGGVLEKRATRIIDDKSFHVPKVGKPDNMDRVLRVRRAV